MFTQFVSEKPPTISSPLVASCSAIVKFMLMISWNVGYFLLQLYVSYVKTKHSGVTIFQKIHVKDMDDYQIFMARNMSTTYLDSISLSR